MIVTDEVGMLRKDADMGCLNVLKKFSHSHRRNPILNPPECITYRRSVDY
jgi:hypothetical protein